MSRRWFCGILVCGAVACGEDAKRRVVAERDTARLEIHRVCDAAAMFFIEHRRLPTLEELITPDATGGPCLEGFETVPRDPWGNEYRLRPGQYSGTFEITSDGPDGVPGTEDDVSSRRR
jgi:general secretion pathway protein G